MLPSNFYLSFALCIVVIVLMTDSSFNDFFIGATEGVNTTSVTVDPSSTATNTTANMTATSTTSKTSSKTMSMSVDPFNATTNMTTTVVSNDPSNTTTNTTTTTVTTNTTTSATNTTTMPTNTTMTPTNITTTLVQTSSTTIVNPSIPLIKETRFIATFPTPQESADFLVLFNQFYADRATNGVIVYQVYLHIISNTTSPFGSTVIEFSIDQNERDAELASRAATFFAQLTQSELFDIFTITNSCVERLDEKEKEYNETNSKVGAQSLCPAKKTDSLLTPKNVGAIVVVILVIALFCCGCCYFYKKMGAKDDNDDGERPPGEDPADADESHLPPGMRRRAREAMQNAHLQSQNQSSTSRTSAYTGVTIMDEFPGGNGTTSGVVEDPSVNWTGGAQEMTPREGDSNTTTHQNFTAASSNHNNVNDISTVYDDILNQDQFGGASAVDNQNNRRW